MSSNPQFGDSSRSHAQSRRHFIVGTLTVSLAGILGIAYRDRLPSALAQGGSTATDADFGAFIRLSQYLTGKTALDMELGRAIYAGLVGDNADFRRHVADLNAFVTGSETPAGALQAVLDDSRAAFADVPRRVMSGWYLGVVGAGKNARAVAYEQALMYPPVADVIVMPSYARGVPGYWSVPPRYPHP
ncbi:sugar dehydrogenase complex small subunit [Burkholderia anthina]|uniref:sugar dehydrogenase complex small subunit n=1 Tax=Burkholderia anthina TaxID=179879 RepID=UPI00158A9903|nr:sugar dehydrogenase complex small subunit [Burkholderia anthina]